MNDIISREIKCIIAQSCPKYIVKDNMSIMNLSNISQSCNNCVNFVYGKCKKGLFNEIKKTVELN